MREARGLLGRRRVQGWMEDRKDLEGQRHRGKGGGDVGVVGHGAGARELVDSVRAKLGAKKRRQAKMTVSEAVTNPKRGKKRKPEAGHKKGGP